MADLAAIVRPNAAPVEASLALPGSKSITNRALLLAAMAQGRSRLTGALASDDTLHMSNALRAMGVSVTADATTFNVQSSGALTAPGAPLFLGNAGTATRFLTAVLGTQTGRFVVDGDEHMRKRPIKPLVEALQRLGVKAETATGCPPVIIDGEGGFQASKVQIDGGLSSQYVSAILMAAPLHSQPFTLELLGADIGAKGYVEITLNVMRAFGAKARQVGEGAWQIEPTGYQAASYAIEPDASAATYLWGIEKISGGRIDLGIDPSAMMQPDAKAWDVIQAWPYMPAVIDGSQMQDAVPTLAVLAAFNKTPVRFVGIENLRVKECDRIVACRAQLNKLKPGLAEEQGDDLVVHSDPSLAGQDTHAEIETYSDHRIAMAFAMLGLLMPGIKICDPRCVNKTYPAYWDDLKRLGVDVTLLA